MHFPAMPTKHLQFCFQPRVLQPNQDLLCRYSDYLHGTVAMSAPLFLNIVPQSSSTSSSSKGSLPSLSLKGKQGKQKGGPKGKAASKATSLEIDRAHLKYTIQEVKAWAVLRCMCLP